jgi:hypothetical protein
MSMSNVLRGWEGMPGRSALVVTFKGSRLRFRDGRNGYAHKSTEVDLLDGDWPSDRDLITLADGDEPNDDPEQRYGARHFGGSVTRTTPTSAHVVVHTD